MIIRRRRRRRHLIRSDLIQECRKGVSRTIRAGRRLLLLLLVVLLLLLQLLMLLTERLELRLQLLQSR